MDRPACWAIIQFARRFIAHLDACDTNAGHYGNAARRNHHHGRSKRAEEAPERLVPVSKPSPVQPLNRRTAQDQSRRRPSQVFSMELVQQLLKGLSSCPTGRRHGVTFFTGDKLSFPKAERRPLLGNRDPSLGPRMWTYRGQNWRLRPHPKNRGGTFYRVGLLWTTRWRTDTGYLAWCFTLDSSSGPHQTKSSQGSRGRSCKKFYPPHPGSIDNGATVRSDEQLARSCGVSAATIVTSNFLCHLHVATKQPVRQCRFPNARRT
jgi:hypothetical protein